MRVIRLILETLFWMVAAGALIFGVAILVGLVLTPALGYVAAVAVVGLLPLGVRTMRAIRRRRAAIALTYLEQAVRLNLPLPRMLAAAQRSERGTTSLRLADLGQRIEEGYPIGVALAAAVPELSERDGALIETAERIGRLPHALARIVAEQAEQVRRNASADAVFIRAYPLVMAVVLGLVISTLAIFVMPKYEQIFKDMKVRLPPLTTNTLAVAQELGQPVLVLIALLVLLLSGAALWQTVHPIRLSRSPLRHGRDYFRWIFPYLHGLDRDRALADACDVLADALGAGAPADSALIEATQLEMNQVLRRRFARWAELVTGGASLAEAARQAKLPPMIAGMLATVHGPEAPNVFRFLARYYRTRFSRSAALLRAATVPAMVFVFALLVGCVAGAMFIPMINLVDSLSYRAMRL